MLFLLSDVKNHITIAKSKTKNLQNMADTKAIQKRLRKVRKDSKKAGATILSAQAEASRLRTEKISNHKDI
jgi:hypothetical protein